MFMIQAINTLITHLEMHLMEHFPSCYSEIKANSAEEKLVKIFEAQAVAATAGWFSNWATVPVQSAPTTAFKAPDSDTQSQSKSEAQSAPTTASKPSDFDTQSQSKSEAQSAPTTASKAPDSDTQSQSKSEASSNQWNTLFDLEGVNINDLRLQAKTTASKIDQTKLRFNLTWAQLMTANQLQFEIYRINELKNEDVTLLKMIVVARLQRQLSTFVEMATKELNHRETSSDRFDKSVDEWLANVIQQKVAEAKKMLTNILDSAKYAIAVPFLPSLKAEVKPQPATSEVKVETCGMLVKEFLAFCKQANENRIKHESQQAASMIDVLPASFNLKTPLMLINQAAVKYVLNNLVEYSKYQAHLNCKVSLSWSDWTSYNPQTAIQKREHVLGALEVLDKSVVGKDQKTPAFWEELFKKVHESQSNGVRIESPYLVSKLGSALRVTQEPRLKGMYREIHQSLVTNAPVDAQTVVRRHQDCRL